MPCLKIFTSLAKDKIPTDFAGKVVPVLAKLLHKPEANFMVMVSPQCSLSFGTSEVTPSVVASLESIGSLGVEENKRITKEVTALVQKEFGVPPEHFFLSFYDLRPQDVAKGGITMA